MSGTTEIPDSNDVRWFALKIFRGAVSPIVTACRRDGIEYYRPVHLAERYTAGGVEYVEESVIPNLLFVRTTGERLEALSRTSAYRATAYCYPGTSVPAPIDDRSMEIFMFVVKASARRADAVPLPVDKGDRVRVTEGIFKGAEGYVRRVHGTKRFVVAVEGVAAVAVTHIPRQFLERVESDEAPTAAEIAVPA